MSLLVCRVAYTVPCILLVAMRLFNALFPFFLCVFLSFYELDLASFHFVGPVVTCVYLMF